MASVEVYCIKGTGDKQISPIIDELLSSEFAAVERGTYEINRQWYYAKGQTLSIPFKKANDSTMMMDGDIVSISDSYLGISGNRKVQSVTLSGTASSVDMVVNVQKFDEE